MIAYLEGYGDQPAAKAVVWPPLVWAALWVGTSVAGLFGLSWAVDDLGDTFEDKMPIIVLGIAVLLYIAAEVSRRWF